MFTDYCYDIGHNNIQMKKFNYLLKLYAYNYLRLMGNGIFHLLSYIIIAINL